MACVNGHEAKRLPSGHCSECNRIRCLARYRSKTASIIAKNNQYQKDHPESHRKSSRKWRQENPDRHASQVAKHYADKIKRTAVWADLEKIQLFYEEAKRLSETTGIKHHVDHVIPLHGKFVSGLHTEDNLQVILAINNLRKSNRFR